MYQKTKHSKQQPFFSRSTLTAFAVAGIIAAPFLLTGVIHAHEGGMHEKSASPHTSMSMPMGHDPESKGSQALQESMMMSMKDMESMSTTGNPDHDFALMMVQHHKAAMDMAQIELKYGKDAKLRSMAKHIIASQKEEIKQFERWLERQNRTMAQPKSK